MLFPMAPVHVSCNEPKDKASGTDVCKVQGWVGRSIWLSDLLRAGVAMETEE